MGGTKHLRPKVPLATDLFLDVLRLAGDTPRLTRNASGEDIDLALERREVDVLDSALT
jgi:hypothetical protein